MMINQPQLRIEFINNVDWANLTKYYRFTIDETTIFRVDIDASLVHLTELYNLLNPAEKERANRFLQSQDRNRSIIGRGILRILLGKYLGLNPQQINIKKDGHKKPCFEEAGFPKISFNISHSGKWILFSFNNYPNGVDIEHINASFNYQNLLHITCNQAEQDYIKKSAVPVNSFFELWTRKEALLKATGKGLTDDLSSIPTLNGAHQSPATIISSDKNWHIFTFWVDENYLASAAVDDSKNAGSFFNFQL